MKVDSIVDQFVRSDYFSAWQAERVQSGGYSRNQDSRERYERCQDAAEDGADGSTHRECIQDMRDAFHDWLRDRHRGQVPSFRGHSRRSEFPYRLESAAMAHFDALETWHEGNGSLDQEIG